MKVRPAVLGIGSLIVAGVLWMAWMEVMAWRSVHAQLGRLAAYHPLDIAKLNAQPVQAIDVEGTTPRKFTVSQLRVVYGTDSSIYSCNVPAHFEAPSQPLLADEYLPTIRKGNGISARIYLDAYLAGRCKWQLLGVYAVVRDQNGDVTQPLIAEGYNWHKDQGQIYGNEQPEDTSTFRCGYRHGSFACLDSDLGDASFWPVVIMPGAHRIGFILRDSGYPAPPGYQLPCRDIHGNLCPRYIFHY